LEECGVDIAFAGHVHNYQRGVPLKFVPDSDPKKKGSIVDGEFTLDTVFDGVNNTKPSGVIHIVTGAGGAHLYKPGLEETAPTLRMKYPGSYADFTAKMEVEQHSFVVLDIWPERLQLKCIGVKGDELDNITITK
jgi:hypothetical protein